MKVRENQRGKVRIIFFPSDFLNSGAKVMAKTREQLECTEEIIRGIFHFTFLFARTFGPRIPPLQFNPFAILLSGISIFLTKYINDPQKFLFTILYHDTISWEDDAQELKSSQN